MSNIIMNQYGAQYTFTLKHFDGTWDNGEHYEDIIDEYIRNYGFDVNDDGIYIAEQDEIDDIIWFWNDQVERANNNMNADDYDSACYDEMLPNANDGKFCFSYDINLDPNGISRNPYAFADLREAAKESQEGVNALGEWCSRFLRYNGECYDVSEDNSGSDLIYPVYSDKVNENDGYDIIGWELR